MQRVRITVVFLILGMATLAVAGTMRARAYHAEGALMRADPEGILNQPDLARFALANGHSGFAKHCASCHGIGTGDPSRGLPDLTDGDFLYGDGQVAEIEQIILHGIRSGDRRGWQLASMPAYATPRPYKDEPIPPMTPAQVEDVTQFLLDKQGKATDGAAARRGEQVFAGSGGCYDCHGKTAGGDPAIGAPNLLDDVWLYGDGSPRAIEQTLMRGRAGFSPAFARTLTPTEARAIAVYVASLSRHPKKESPGD